MCIDTVNTTTVVVFILYMIFWFCYKMWAIPTSTSSALKKQQVKSPSI